MEDYMYVYEENPLANPIFWEDKPTLEDVKKILRPGLSQFILYPKENEVAKTPILSYAAKYLPEAIPLLVKAGFDVNAKGSDGQTPIVMACGWGVKPIAIKNLLDAGASASESVYVAWPANLHLTPMKHFLLESFMSSGRDDHPNCKEDCEILKLLLNAGAEQVDVNGEPLVHRFCRWDKYNTPSSHKLALKTVLECGCDLNAKDKDGETVFTKLGRAMEENYQKMLLCRDYGQETTPEIRNLMVANRCAESIETLLSFDKAVFEEVREAGVKKGEGIIESVGDIQPSVWVQNKRGEDFSSLTQNIPFAKELLHEWMYNGLTGVHSYVEELKEETKNVSKKLKERAVRERKKDPNEADKRSKMASKVKDILYHNSEPLSHEERFKKAKKELQDFHTPGKRLRKNSDEYAQFIGRRTALKFKKDKQAGK